MPQQQAGPDEHDHAIKVAELLTLPMQMTESKVKPHFDAADFLPCMVLKSEDLLRL